jgi:hypothetical protein
MTSDAFFEQGGPSDGLKYDVIFIDGLHTAEQVTKDVRNAVLHLKPRGVIVMHDCHPRTEAAQRPVWDYGATAQWNGDVWKAAALIRLWHEVDFRILDADNGVGVVLPWRPNSLPQLADGDLARRAIDGLLEWGDVGRDGLLPLVSIGELRGWIGMPLRDG